MDECEECGFTEDLLAYRVNGSNVVLCEDCASEVAHTD